MAFLYSAQKNMIMHVPMSAMVGSLTAVTMGIFISLSCMGKLPVLYEKGVAINDKDATLKHRLAVADSFFSVVFYPVIFSLAMKATADLAGDVERRWLGITNCSNLFQLFYVTRMILHCPIQWITLSDNRRHLYQMTAHHVFSVVCFVGALVSGRMHFWACFAGCCEATTIFLTALEISKNHLQTVGKSARRGFLVSSAVALWTSFIPFRLVLFSAWLIFFAQDLAELPEAIHIQLTVAERYLNPATISMLLYLSCGWMLKLTRLVCLQPYADR